MTSVAYLVPYFGKLPQSFPMWLLSCKMNPTINWILITDDQTTYDFPKNVQVKYCTYDEIKKRISSHFDFPVIINKPWRLCEYRPAYGEIFEEELKGFDFWGHCDMDLIWGDIRKFLSEDVFLKYDKIGFQGHSTLYRNTPEVNARYKYHAKDAISYKEAFQSDFGRCFDEGAQEKIYKELNIEYYHEPNFAHLDAYANNFYLLYLPDEDAYKNRRQVIVWDNGKIFRKYTYNGKVYTEEFMYFHTFMRPIKYKISQYNEKSCYIAYPDVIREIDRNEITANFIEKHGKCSAPVYYMRLAYSYRKKLTFKKIWKNLKVKIKVAQQRRH